MSPRKTDFELDALDLRGGMSVCVFELYSIVPNKVSSGTEYRWNQDGKRLVCFTENCINRFTNILI